MPNLPIGKPDIAGGVLDPWRAQIRQLAAFPNVICKLSGLVTEADHARWTVEQLAPYAGHVIECFGVERVAFGGDWPVALEASGYQRWVAALDTITAGLSLAERRRLWSDNAREFYRIAE